MSGQVGEWLGIRSADPRFARFTGHFTALRAVLDRMLAAIRADVDSVDPAGPSGEVYERCRESDERLTIVRRLFEWYRDKYDQRLDDAGGLTLRAADEVIRSCWAGAFGALDKAAPPGPLAYLDVRFDALATPRVSVPSDLRAADDTVIGEYVRELPIPIVALPAAARSEPWWLVVAAHETAHHIHHELGDDPIARTRDAVGAVGHVAGEHQPCWAAWAQEIFADAFAVLSVGSAAAWAVEELQHGPPGRIATMPSARRRYPPPLVRTALLGALAEVAGAAGAGPGPSEVGKWLATVDPAIVEPPVRKSLAAHLDRTQAVAEALATLDVGGISLREVCGWAPGVLGADGPVARWTAALRSARPTIPGREAPTAAIHGIAGGVRAYRELVEEAAGGGDVAARRHRLAATLPELLASCGPPGVLAAQAPPDTVAVAERLTAHLFTTAGTRVGP
ncbi:hypothetical protein H7X46_12190 [Pseudonocardia sp. C8]|uniref:hypothetical protein n=1 Tax=Pseudonocardia sp. C8 TaxID=2762759 RepID=UPI001642F806|nr:hypothetical protein [Pseudonocardia sp. C8]MBC3191823.1 hypothetical protein [Pseudonocardia sp. C8]